MLRSRVPGVALLLVLALATRACALTVGEEEAVDRRLQEEFGVRTFDPKRDYGPGGFLNAVDASSPDQRTDAKGRRLLLPVAFGGMLTGIQTGVKKRCVLQHFISQYFTILLLTLFFSHVGTSRSSL